ncbi:unnamed protein product [Sphenostylis stenocarpa]|uniref:Uncharacterized protein n=1 Tax=Sphenostylis stenocarpa TaxID=92480 RepID=A0AA86T126_9FABA|nr:unnamed protein product [Sphenostylis stenocarpa]
MSLHRTRGDNNRNSDLSRTGGKGFPQRIKAVNSVLIFKMKSSMRMQQQLKGGQSK